MPMRTNFGAKSLLNEFGTTFCLIFVLCGYKQRVWPGDVAVLRHKGWALKSWQSFGHMQ